MNEVKKMTIETAPAAPPAAPKTLSRGDLKATTGGGFKLWGPPRRPIQSNANG